MQIIKQGGRPLPREIMTDKRNSRNYQISDDLKTQSQKSAANSQSTQTEKKASKNGKKTELCNIKSFEQRMSTKIPGIRILESCKNGGD